MFLSYFFIFFFLFFFKRTPVFFLQNFILQLKLFSDFFYLTRFLERRMQIIQQQQQQKTKMPKVCPEKQCQIEISKLIIY